MPPKLEARAIPRMRQGANVESTGKVRRMGWIREKQRTGAATLLIHMLATVATSMLTSKTRLGLVPALDRTNVAMDFAIPNLLRAPAIANPPSKSIMTGENMLAKTRLVASGALSCS